MLTYSTSQELGKQSLEEAYLKAIQQSDPRHAWHWLKKLEHNLGSFRCQLTRAVLTKSR